MIIRYLSNTIYIYKYWPAATAFVLLPRIDYHYQLLFASYKNSRSHCCHCSIKTLQQKDFGVAPAQPFYKIPGGGIGTNTLNMKKAYFVISHCHVSTEYNLLTNCR